MNYAIGCAFNLEELTENFPYKKLKTTCKQCEEVIGDPHRKFLVQRIFRLCYKLVINDIINRNVYFWLPLTGKTKSSMHMQRFKGRDFLRLRKAGKWADVDFLKSNFQGYLIALYMYNNAKPRVKPVYLNPDLTKKITENTNKGMNYGDSALDTTLETYLPTIYHHFPTIIQSDVIRILKFCWKSLYLHNSYGGDTFIVDYDIWSYIGHLKKSSLEYFNYYIKKLAIKLRVLHHRRLVPWDGYYYFALTDAQYENYKSQQNSRGRKRKYFTFGTVMLYEILDDCKISEASCKYIFKVPILFYRQQRSLIKDFKTDGAELIIEREPLTFKDILVNNNKYELL